MKMGSLKSWGFPKMVGFPPKSSIWAQGLNHYFHHPFWGFYPYFWKHPVSRVLLNCQYTLLSSKEIGPSFVPRIFVGMVCLSSANIREESGGVDTI